MNLLFSKLFKFRKMEPNFTEKELTVGSRVIIESLYNGISVFIDKETGYYYAGKICFDCKKRFENIYRNQDYELMKQAISATTQIRVVDLELVFEGMGNGYRSKWIHPLLVHTVCEWASKKYAVQVSMLMNEKAKQALIEKRSLQEQIDKERIHTERLKDELNEAKDGYKQAELHYKEESKAHEETKKLLANIQIQNEKLIAQNERQSEDIDTLHNMLFGVSSQVSDVQRTLHHRDADIEKLTKAAGFVVHEMKKQTIARSVTDANNDILVLYRSELKPTSDDVRAQASESQLWLGSYNGDKANYIPSKLPADYEEIYYIESNRLNSFKYLISHESITPFIIRIYQRSILIEEDELESFIETVELVLNKNKEFKSIINLDNAKADIEAKRVEMKELRKQREIKANILKEHSPVHVNVNRFKRLVYCYIVNELGKEILTPLNDVEREYAISHTWFYRYGTNGKYIQELTITSIEKASFSKYSDARIRYE